MTAFQIWSLALLAPISIVCLCAVIIGAWAFIALWKQK